MRGWANPKQKNMNALKIIFSVICLSILLPILFLILGAMGGMGQIGAIAIFLVIVANMFKKKE